MERLLLRALRLRLGGRKVNLAYGQESLDAAQGCRIMDENERRMLLRRSYPKGKEVNQR